jgi:hypothetical protein
MIILSAYTDRCTTLHDSITCTIEKENKSFLQATTPAIQFYQWLKLQQQILPSSMFTEEACITHDGMNIRSSQRAWKIHMN